MGTDSGDVGLYQCTAHGNPRPCAACGQTGNHRPRDLRSVERRDRAFALFRDRIRRSPAEPAEYSAEWAWAELEAFEAVTGAHVVTDFEKYAERERLKLAAEGDALAEMLRGKSR